ncbi:uncharacterized protein [Nicotiana tomentosiformis]|uniref:uncharacterized protein n=1 Tax=Nicotiana tomentosiformis TaxID=4098 RepID=UPI00388CBF10
MDLNLRQHRWLELLKDYDITILYYLGKENVVGDALSRKAESTGSLAFISVEERPLALDIQSLANRLVMLDISEPSRVLICVVAQSSLFEQIKVRQFDDLNLLVLREAVLQGGSKEVTIGVTKMYLDLRQHYWWQRMKKDIVEHKFDAVWVIVDRLTKLAYFIPVVTTYSSERLAQIYIQEIVRLRCVPVSIISDRGPQFTSHF